MAKKAIANKQQGGFGVGHLINPIPQWSEKTAMTYNSAPIQQINPDPNILTLLAIGTAENVRAHILRQHTLGVAEADAWSRPIPVPNCPGKVVCALNRIMI
jgi:hypothetical protein